MVLQAFYRGGISAAAITAALNAPVPTDRYWENVSLLAGFDGTDAATTFIDESQPETALAFSALGNAQIDTTRSLFGGSSLLLDGTGDAALVADDAQLDLGSGDFTIEFFFNSNVNYETGSSRDAPLTKWQATGNLKSYGFFFSNTTFEFIYSTDGSTNSTNSQSWPASLVADNWYYCSIVRVGATLYFFSADVTAGDSTTTLLGTASIGTDAFFDSSASLAIGGNNEGTSALWNGWIDEVRITKGVGRYTAAYSVPSEAFPRESRTVDPDFSVVTFLSNFEGADLTNPLDMDESPQEVPNTWPDIDTAVGSISTTQFQLGTSSYKNLSNGSSGNTHAAFLENAVPNQFPDTNEDFTWEGWAYIDTTMARVGQGDFIGSFGASGNRGYILAFNEDEIRVLYATSSSGFTTLTYAATFQPDIWYHLAFVKTGLDMEVFLDGVSLGSQTMSAWFRPSSQNLEFGSHESSGGNGLGGYLDEWRFTRGVARYANNFRVPLLTYPREYTDESFNEVSLLLGFDGSITDESPDARTVTANGGAAISTITRILGSDSLNLDGDGDYLEIAHATELSAANNVDKTYECFIYVDSLAEINTIFCKRNTSVATDGEFVLLLDTDGTLAFTALDTSSSAVASIAPADVLSTGTTYHVALTRESGTWRLFLDGVLLGSSTETALPGDNSAVFWIGRERTHPGREFDGRIDEVRVTHGVARYTAAFTPPIGKFPRAAPTDPDINSTVLLLGFDSEADGATTTTDESPAGTTVTFTGAGAAVDDAEAKFGGRSVVLGTDAYLSIPDSTGVSVANSNDKTFECWIRSTSLAATQSIFNKRDATFAEEFRLIVLTSGLLRLDTYDGTTVDVSITGTTVMAVNTWYHVAATRQNGTWKIFVNGNLEAVGTETLQPVSNGAALRIGSSAFNASRFFVGNIDEIRITDGLARYTEDFTPPTGKFPRT